MPFGSFLKRYAPYIGAAVGSVVPGVGTAIGGAVGGLIGGAISTNENNAPTDPADLNPASGTALNSLLAQQQGRNIGQEAQTLAQQSGVGFDAGQFSQAAAIRGAGRNAFGKLLAESRERAQQQRGQFSLNARQQLGQERDQNLLNLTQTQIGANQFAIGQSAANTQQANDRSDSFLNSALGVGANLIGGGELGDIFGSGNGGTGVPLARNPFNATYANFRGTAPAGSGTQSYPSIQQQQGAVNTASSLRY